MAEITREEILEIEHQLITTLMPWEAKNQEERTMLLMEIEGIRETTEAVLNKLKEKEQEAKNHGIKMDKT